MQTQTSILRCPNCNSPDICWKDEYQLGWHCKLCGSSFHTPVNKWKSSTQQSKPLPNTALAHEIDEKITFIAEFNSKAELLRMEIVPNGSRDMSITPEEIYHLHAFLSKVLKFYQP